MNLCPECQPPVGQPQAHRIMTVQYLLLDDGLVHTLRQSIPITVRDTVCGVEVEVQNDGWVRRPNTQEAIL